RRESSRLALLSPFLRKTRSGHDRAVPRAGVARMSGIRWWQWLPWLPWRLVAVVEEADEVPNRMPRNGIVLVGSQRHPKWLAFDCPCRTGHRVMVNLDPTRSPRWRLSGEKALTI